MSTRLIGLERIYLDNMRLSPLTLSQLAKAVSGDSYFTPGLQYISDLQNFLSNYVDNTTYDPCSSKAQYIERMLKKINGTPSITNLIEDLVDPRRFLDIDLDVHNAVAKMNEFFLYDGVHLVSQSNKYQLVEINDTHNNLPDVTICLDGWDKINSMIDGVKLLLVNAKTEVQYQSIGMHSREIMLLIAKTVYDANKHPPIDDKQVGKSDIKRMLEAYIEATLNGSENATLRKYAKSCVELANELTHKSTATSTYAHLCVSAVISLINVIGILEGR